MSDYMIVTAHGDEVASGFASVAAATPAAQRCADSTGRVLYIVRRTLDGDDQQVQINPRASDGAGTTEVPESWIAMSAEERAEWEAEHPAAPYR